MAEKQYKIRQSKKPHYIMTCIEEGYEFAVYHVIFSGWSKPRQKYHVIREDGEYGDSEYLGLMSMDQIIDKYNITEVLDIYKVNRLSSEEATKVAAGINGGRSGRWDACGCTQNNTGGKWRWRRRRGWRWSARGTLPRPDQKTRS